MGNMTYCKFRNTLKDLEQCANELEGKDINEFINELSPEERQAAIRLIRICSEVSEFQDELEG